MSGAPISGPKRLGDVTEMIERVMTGLLLQVGRALLSRGGGLIRSRVAEGRANRRYSSAPRCCGFPT